ncbi:UDP-N-acetylmuramoyl-L-alanyl-D-glutamate--2,6-diaminopimelate ligase [Chengkuizengella axinellae]|uniref:UDP-N-acetylmuramoyl-L-alanyl-D-glutamate--2,6-diaminopimelate ligase n=1 Tax=Chengkuizengella axinellae TaxID=3064388 RepID=A0ABT9IVP4_9BACL|nr:UDP-N-acetylmuramoyl-L-alanyl-D-glutamate--2,6-diaminopimelate ligase [Chengkuizengella sp. 2205SS18-9]MDP5273152.1 UDP-N-acetylmuramoyl-L-alanyl-D-glutamate--2,6-diaminopimelate ligase [Chengkuizengella sp. 2205SS18-9]
MLLKEFASLLKLSTIHGDADTVITGIQTDSRKIKSGDLFVCVVGHRMDGHNFAEQAVENGASALVVERKVKLDIPTIYVKDSRIALALFASAFYQYPSHKLKLIGVTGTNGKTTTTYLIDKILRDRFFKTGLMGTIQMKIDHQTYSVENTTQESLELQKNLNLMVKRNIDYCIMEVSSHALEMGRVIGCRYRTAVFTNLTQDHLDYHGTMEKYKQSKGLLFSRLGNTFSDNPNLNKFAIVNGDDEASSYFKKLTTAEVFTYGIEKEDVDVRATDIQITSQGTQFKVISFAGTLDFHLRLIGKFNIYNALAAVATSLIEGISLEEIKGSLKQMKGIDGRFEAVYENQDYLVIVDYSHTPDSLENALKTISEFAEGKIVCVFGCGGDRDRTKRPLMGRIAAKYSDYVYVTSDNPRTEDPKQILIEIEQGISDSGMAKNQYELIVDRYQAIESAIKNAKEKDIILIAGKGHETYQEVHGVKNEFDDRLVAKKVIRSIIK